ncbi:TonB-dependent hemoglobin/transferrin/lactoferrin family receptor [Ensifer soli]|uniref:TonB-dependent hemoglobin/transferrin/lactoferrin family receptor n=1 Tax=Ciceribacter sp. sgz301302 TaxID=3342379 RepID=UPI0035B839F6
MLRLFRLTLLVGTGLASLPALAQEADPSADDCVGSVACANTTALDAITISATRTNEAPIRALGGVSVIETNAPAVSGMGRVADLLAGVPGVSTDGAGDESGTAVNIRGLQDFGRVAVIVDGARQNFQQTGHRANGTFFLDPALIRRVTVARGPIANVYGSGAIGGVVSFETINPSEFLRDGETWALSGTTGFETNGGAPTVGTTGAYRIGDGLSVLGNVNYRKSGEYQDGDGKAIYNSGEEVVSGLGKAEFVLNDFNTITAGYMLNRFDYVTGSPGATQYDTLVDTRTATAKWRYDNPDDRLFNVNASVYWTTTDKEEVRSYTSTPALLGTSRDLGIRTYGTDVANTSRFDTGALEHEVTIGGDVFHDKVTSADPFGTAAYFTPGGTRLAYGAFVQDQVRYQDWLRVIGGVRYDGYSLDGRDGTESDGNRLSPKIGAGIMPFEGTAAGGLELYASYAEGYRAPSTTETLITGTHPGSFSFEFRPNPHLIPETAHTIEVGVNYARDGIFSGGDSLRLKAAYFHNDVDNYIDGVYHTGTGGAADYYQYENVASATIHGVELEATYDTGIVFASLSGSILRGDNTETGGPLGTIAPDTVTTTLGRRFLDDTLTAGIQWEHAAAQRRVPAGAPESDGFDTVNLFATLEPDADFNVGVKVKNLFNTQYTRYLDEDASPGLSVLVTLSGRIGG